MKDRIVRFIALDNAGRAHEMKQELIERSECDRLEEEFKTAVENRNFKLIDSLRKKIGRKQSGSLRK